MPDIVKKTVASFRNYQAPCPKSKQGVSSKVEVPIKLRYLTLIMRKVGNYLQVFWPTLNILEKCQKFPQKMQSLSNNANYT